LEILLFLVPVVAAFWVFFDARKRGYSTGKSFLWALGVFLAMIIFLPLYLLDRRRKMSLASAPPSAGARPSVSCFYCGRPYEGNPKLCPHCGQNLKV
jgi:hypothetical protein